MRVPVAALKASREINLDLFTSGDGGETLTLFRGRSYTVSREDFERLENNGISSLYLLNDQYEHLHDSTRENMNSILADDELEVADRFQILQTAVATEVENAFRRIAPDEVVHQSKAVGKHLSGLISSGNVVPHQLFQVMRHDFNTFTHVVNVSSYCVLLAKQLGHDDPAELEDIAVGGMLHDIGKRLVSPAILNKPGRLTDEEFNVIKQHPYTGYVELCERTDVKSGQLMMVYQHHERIDGTGYPVGITGSEMHRFARICAVVDVFDAITGNRPYRQPMSRQEGLEHLTRIAGTHLDPEIVRCWKSTMDDR